MPASAADFAPIRFSTDDLPGAALASRVGDGRGAATQVISHAAEPLRLLVSYLALLQKEVPLATPEVRQAVVDHIHDLASLALANRDTREHGLSAGAAARLGAALAHIAENFTEPGLTLATVARRQGVSPRYLQRLLEASGTSFTARVSELRLQRAFALLAKGHGRRISDIALQVGFSDISNFNRLFRSRFGDTPTGVRARRRHERTPDATPASVAAEDSTSEQARPAVERSRLTGQG